MRHLECREQLCPIGLPQRLRLFPTLHLPLARVPSVLFPSTRDRGMGDEPEGKQPTYTRSSLHAAGELSMYGEIRSNQIKCPWRERKCDSGPNLESTPGMPQRAFPATAGAG